MLDCPLKIVLRYIGRGVKKRLVANEKITMAKAKPGKLSRLNEPFQRKLYDSTPREVNSTVLSILTKRRSKIINGSAIKATERMNATTLKALQRNKV